VSELLTNLDSRHLDELATKDVVRAEVAEVRADVASLRAELHVEVRRMLVWSISANTALTGVLMAAIRLS